MNQEPYKSPFLGLIGAIGTITLSDLNLILGLITGLVSLSYVCFKFWQDIKESKKKHESRED